MKGEFIEENKLKLLFETLTECGFKLIHSDYNTHIMKDDVMYMTINRHNWENESNWGLIEVCYRILEKERELQE